MTLAQKIVESIQRENSLDDIFDAMYKELQKIVEHQRLGLALFDEDSKKLVQVKTRSHRKIFLDDGFAANIAGSTLEKILYSGEVRIINDLPEHFAQRPSKWTALILKEGMCSSLTLPLKLQNKPIGVIFFTDERKNAFSKKHVGVLTKIASQLSILIEKGKWISDLTQSHERYRILFEMSHDGIFVCPSLTEKFLTFNANFHKWLGYAYEELFSYSFNDLIAHNQQIPSQSVFQIKLRSKNSENITLEVRLLKINYKGKTLLQGITKNISEIVSLQEQLHEKNHFARIVGKNYRMQEIYRLIEQLEKMPTTVLIQGESGTGKELIAKAIHHTSIRQNQTFVVLNCGAIAENLLESELFGHVKGAFTGAIQDRIGRFELAHKGTLFLDEIGELGIHLQVKLLRALQEGEFEKVGCVKTQKVDVRILAATNKNLQELITQGKFREDLYYRLNVVNIQLPPLRDRKDDLPLLLQHFIQKYREKTQKQIHNIAPTALKILMEYQFPGNIRELENIIEHSFVKCQTTHIERDDLPSHLAQMPNNLILTALEHKNPLQKLEQELLRQVVEQCNGKLSDAAARLGISRTTLWRKLNIVIH